MESYLLNNKPEKVEPFSLYLENLNYKRERAKVFDDFLTLIICCFSMKKKEDEYFRVINQYTREEISDFCKAIGSLIIEMDRNPFKDPFALYFQEAISKGHNGQFFTPPCISDLLTRLVYVNGGDSDNDKKIYDPACGSGGLFLAAAAINRNGYFVGCDISEMCCKMTVINLCLNSLRGEVWHMNTLTLEVWRKWKIVYISGTKIPFIVEC